MSTTKSQPIRPLAGLGGAKPDAPEWFEWALAHASIEAQVEVGGAQIGYSVWGDAAKPGLLFIHGGRAHRNWWRPFAPFLASDYHVAAIDLSGMGDSNWRETYSMDLLVEEVFAVIDAANLGSVSRPILVGHSFGGWVTLAAVERAGERLGGAVVLDSPLGLPDPSEGYVISARVPDTARKKRSARVYDTIAAPIERFRLLPNQPAEHLYLMDYIARTGIREVAGENGEPGWTWKFDPQTGENFTVHFERDLLRGARCPLAFIYGENSVFARGEAISHLRQQAQGRSPFIIMPQAHHHLMMDQPLAFVSTMRTLLSCWPVRVGF